MKLCDLTGKRFGNLTVLSRADDYITPKGCHKTQWLCKCVCGKRIITLATHLKSGHTSSCGCSHAKHIKFNRYDLSGEYGIGFATNNNTQFKFDLDDYDKIKDYTWSCHTICGRNYISSTSKHIMLHRIVMDAPDGMVVDHINHDTTDNRKQNMRVCSIAQNNMNSYRKYMRGIRAYKRGTYAVYVGGTCIGRFDSIMDAQKCREEYEIKHFGEYRYSKEDIQNEYVDPSAHQPE